MNENTRAGLLLNAIGAGCEIFMNLCEKYSPDEIFAGESFWKELGLNANQQTKISKLLYDKWLDGELTGLEKLDARFITANDLDYPARLKDLAKPPVGLYVRGGANLSLPSIAIVGTRKCSDYARTTAANLAKALARQGVTIISGGARGIDTAGHRGCLTEGGVTIAVFGTGINKIYPKENRDLFARILERGALVSEYPLGTGGESWHFPQRNRIIVGMASRVVVAESPEGGGAMMTARTAFELGREVWSIPGRITDDVSKGTNILISEGAKVVVSVNEFVESITGHKQLAINFDETQPVKTAPELSDNEKIIYGLLQRQGEQLMDSIVNDSELDFMDVQEALINLEAEGLIINSSGRYSATA